MLVVPVANRCACAASGADLFERHAGVHVLQENVHIVGEVELLSATATTSWWLTWLEPVLGSQRELHLQGEWRQVCVYRRCRISEQSDAGHERTQEMHAR